MLRAICFALVAAVLSGCGHSQINYSPRPSMTWEQAVAVVERGFHEDYGKERAQSVVVTDKAIVLADGNITTGNFAGSAVPVYGSAVIVGTSNAKTIAAGQHIYLDSLMPAMVMKKNGRENRYAVIVRQEPGITARRVFFRSQAAAQNFADALASLKSASSAR
ncbi:MAG: hypothetical protein U1D65_00115 [Pseudomonas sp.]|nr:hypothetical protein [Pseudomonas sp.]MDZ4190400.1 hypothetical protein [Pseudomonas sp.]